MTKVKWINHSSLLIEDGDKIILTDPWFEKPAFGSWLPVPPPIYHPAYLLSLAKANEDNFTLLISHGHDDHCDDDFLKLFPNTVQVIIPKYASPGFSKRVKRAGFTNILEIDGEAEVDGIKYNTFINHDISHDDAIVTIETSDSFVIHANDNWRCPDNIVEGIVKSKGDKPTLMATQIGIATGWPYLYTDYTWEERVKVAQNRLAEVTKKVYDSLVKMNIDHFFVYAGHSKAFTKNEDIMNISGFQPHTFYKSVLSWDEVNYLEMLPGDEFDFAQQKVIRPFKNRYTEQNLKDSSIEFYNLYKRYEATDAHINNKEIFTSDNREDKISEFLDAFNSYVTLNIERLGNFQNKILGSRIRIEDEDGAGVSIIVSKREDSIFLNRDEKVDTVYTLSKPILDAILCGKIIWENAEIGLQMKVSTENDYHNGHILRWLSKFGYVWAKNQKVRMGV
tara:strand:- start:2363 stop:3712 length:1350 start_codon:yes stop_codon:yes gene_type:complete